MGGRVILFTSGQYLADRPVARNVTAIQTFYDVGFRTLGGHIRLTMDLRERRHGWLSVACSYTGSTSIIESG